MTEKLWDLLKVSLKDGTVGQRAYEVSDYGKITSSNLGESEGREIGREGFGVLFLS